MSSAETTGRSDQEPGGNTPRERSALDRLPFSPSNPPKNIHAKPIIKGQVDRVGLNRALRQVGETPDC